MVVALIGLTMGLSGVANADPSFSITVYNGTYQSGVTDVATLANMPPSALITATFTYTGSINFSTSNVNNTFGDFGFTTTNITGYSSSSVPTVANFLNLTMSTPGETGGATNTYMVITGTTGGGLATVLHDDGASLYNGTGAAATAVFESGNPTVEIPNSGNLLPGDFTLVYVESNGAPSVLEMSVPEPSTLLLFGVGLLGLGVIGLRRKQEA